MAGSKVRLSTPYFKLIIASMHFQHVHHLVIVISRGLLPPDNPVVQLPVVARAIDDVIIEIQLGWCQAFQIRRCKCAILGN